MCICISINIRSTLYHLFLCVAGDHEKSKEKKKSVRFDVREESRSKVILFSCESVLIEFDCGFRSEIGFCE